MSLHTVKLNLPTFLFPQLLWIMRHLILQRRSPTPYFFLVLLPMWVPPTLIAKMRNLCNMSPDHILIILSLLWRKFQNGSKSLQRRLTPPFRKRTSSFTTQVLKVICLFSILHSKAMTPCTMTYLINLFHRLAVRILSILKLLTQIAIKCQAVTSHRQRSRKVRRLSIPPL